VSDRQRLKELADSGSPFVQRLIAWRAGWLTIARPKQIAPAGAWRYWLILAGRGFGKTRIGAEDIAYYALANPGVRCGVLGPTHDDVRSVCFEGESGLRAVIPKAFVARYNSQSLEMWLVNGSVIQGVSAEKPDRVRGKQFHRAWCDEIASWTRLTETWGNLEFALRLGTNPQCVITTTPRPIDFLRGMVKNIRAVITKGNTFENAANLAASALEMYREVYANTRKGLQELYAEILESNENALWSWARIEASRLKDEPSREALQRIVIAVDPAVTTQEDSDETGIIVAGVGDDGTVYVLEDLSGHYTPLEWAKLVLATYARWQADLIVAETNQGGDLVEANLSGHAEGVFFAFEKVHAKRGKYLRAEPVAALYEKGKVRHVGRFDKLEKQMTDFVGSTSKGSPDRLDALVYAVGECALGTSKNAFW